eukprot:7208607-Prymnesium_polylepis.1
MESSNLNVLMLGVAARDGKIMMANDSPSPVWGDVLLSTKALRDMREARALTYVEVRPALNIARASPSIWLTHVEVRPALNIA